MTDHCTECNRTDPVFTNAPSRGNDTDGFSCTLSASSTGQSIMDESDPRPDGISLRSNGSTVRVSSTEGDDQSVLTTTVDCRTGSRMPFRYLCGPSIPHIQKLKCALDGSGSAQVTISRREDGERGGVLTKLRVLPDCEKDPYISSDLRIDDDSRFPRRHGFPARSVFTGISGRVAPPLVLTPHLDARSTNDDLSDRVTTAPQFHTTAAVLVAAP